MSTQCYSNLTEKKTKRCSLLGVSYCFSLLKHEKSMAEYILRGGGGCILIPMSSSDGKRK